MSVERSTAVVSSRFAVVEGVLRLSAAALSGVHDVLVVADLPQLLEEVTAEGVLLAVWDLDRAGGIDDVRELVAALPAVPVVVLSERRDGALVLDAMRAGVRGFLVKPDALRDLGRTLRRVVDGERVIDPSLDDVAVLALGRFARQAREATTVLATLSPRETEILLLMGEGLTMHQIARRLGISPRTVETHATKLYRKLEVRTRVQAVARAASLGLMELS
jgi:DNA-binding NarL/FixJ family response regulator